MEGGSGSFSGTVGASTMGNVTVKGSILGGAGQNSGAITSVHNIGTVSVTGDLQGGGGVDSGTIHAGGNMAAANVGGSVIGSGTEDTGKVTTTGNLGKLTIGVDLRGGSAADSGDIAVGGTLGTVTIGGNIQGGSGSVSGALIVTGNVAAVTVSGSVIGGSSDSSGAILADGNLGPLVIGGSLIGGSIVGVEPETLIATGYVQAINIASVHVGGSIISGTQLDVNDIVLTQSGSIRATDDIGPMTVGGSLVGNGEDPVIISAGGLVALPSSAKQDVALASVTVLGRVQRADILAGYNVNLNPVNGNASIGPVVVGLDWIASSIAAGVETADGSLNFGQLTDHEINAGRPPDLISTIASIRIGGQALGSTDALEHFGFVAEEIGSLSVGGTNFGLRPGPHNDDLVVGATNNLTLVEVA